MAELRGDPPAAPALLARAIRRLAPAAADDRARPRTSCSCYLRARFGAGPGRAAAGALLRRRDAAAGPPCAGPRRIPGRHRANLAARPERSGRVLEGARPLRRGAGAVPPGPADRARPARTKADDAGHACTTTSPAANTRAGARRRRWSTPGGAWPCAGAAPAPTHPSTIADEAALAPILDDLGKRTEAERLYRQALRYYLRRFGERSYEVSVTLANLGALYHNLDDLPRAEQHLRRALGIDENCSDAPHPELALSLNNLAVVLAARGDRVRGTTHAPARAAHPGQHRRRPASVLSELQT